MILQRLNLDSSWHIDWNGMRILLDPWLSGPEIDGFAWLNKQWHIREPVAPDAVPAYDFLVYSQNYEDHCHTATLAELNPKTHILATEKAWRKAKKLAPKAEILLIPDQHAGDALRFDGFEFRAIHPGNRRDPVYYSLVITAPDGSSWFYSPHGFHPKADELNHYPTDNCRLLMTTLTDFRLPGIMGGHVNPGPDNALELIELLKPKKLLNTHDEQKKASGLVSLLGNIRYHETESLDQRIRELLIESDHYDAIRL